MLLWLPDSTTFLSSFCQMKGRLYLSTVLTTDAGIRPHALTNGLRLRLKMPTAQTPLAKLLTGTHSLLNIINKATICYSAKVYNCNSCKVSSVNQDESNSKITLSLISYSLLSHCIHSCNGKNSCTVRVSNSVFGEPCVGTYKYLDVAYVCDCK